MAKNPFTPTFGIMPPYLAGRADLIDDMATAFDNGWGDPNLSTIIVGARGCGKTSLLLRIAEEARQRGWIAVSVVASEDMLDDVIQRAWEQAREFVAPEGRRHLTGISIAQVLGLEWTIDPAANANWRTRMNALLDELGKRDVGLLIEVDEVSVSVDAMVKLASTYQLFAGEGRKVALVMAGLPKNTTELIDDDRVSFLRRARQRRLGRISDVDVAAAFRMTIEEGGRRIDDDALACAVQAVAGYAYMMQLVGYCSWAASGNDHVIELSHVQRGIEMAMSEFRDGVLESTYHEMSAGDRAFAAAMLPDEGGSTLSQVAARMGKGTNYASTYRRRLLRQGVIEEGPGKTFDFAIPGLREYLREMTEE